VYCLSFVPAFAKTLAVQGLETQEGENTTCVSLIQSPNSTPGGRGRRKSFVAMAQAYDASMLHRNEPKHARNSK